MDSSEPTPPGSNSQFLGPLAYLGLFLLCQLTQCVYRESQREDSRKQGEQLDRIEAMLNDRPAR